MFHLCVAVLQHDVTGYSYAGVLTARGKKKKIKKKKEKMCKSLDGTQKRTPEREWGGLAVVAALLCDAAQTIGVSVKTR